MEIITKDNIVKAYNDGVWTIEETSYTNVVLIIDKLKNIIQDEY